MISHNRYKSFTCDISGRINPDIRKRDTLFPDILRVRSLKFHQLANKSIYPHDSQERNCHSALRKRRCRRKTRFTRLSFSRSRIEPTRASLYSLTTDRLG